MNSKLELRNEAVRIASNLEGITAENIVETAEKIEKYINGNAVLPDVMDMKEMFKTFSDLQAFKPKDYGQQKEAQELFLGIPKAE